MSTTLDITAVLLVGGMGTRLRSVVPSIPKPLASVGGRSFLELLVRQLRHQGIRRLVMCTGYLADRIENEFGDGNARDVTIEYSREEKPLGTAGALKLARHHLENVSDFLVMNGDSFIETDFLQLLRFHRIRRGLASMAVVSVQNAGRYGTVQVESSTTRVIGFTEKTGADAPGLVNAGLYVFGSAIFQHIPDGPASLERCVFPRVLDRGVYALEHNGMFVDIGTPQDYASARDLYDQLSDAAFRK